MSNRWQLKLATGVQRQDVLGNHYLFGAMFAALCLHVLAYYIWHISPKPEVINIPVRALNIKLGELDTMTEVDIKLLEPSKTNNTKVENILSKLVRSEELEQARKETMVKSIDKVMDNPEKTKKPKPAKKAKPKKLYKFDMRSEGKKKAAPVMSVSARQFVRDLSPPKPAAAAKEKAVPAGNSSATQAEVMARYEQLVSIWIQKFVVYPESSKKAGHTGETVARIRIDRRGNVRYYALERSTGFTLLDKAAINAIKRANPVPAVPKNYPLGDVLEFRIPIRFKDE